MLRIPDAPKSIQKGIPLKNIFGAELVECLAANIKFVYSDFSEEKFIYAALEGLEALEFMPRAIHISKAMRHCLPEVYEEAVEILLASLTPPNVETEGLGLAVMFYQPHSFYVAEYGLDKANNAGRDPFDISMKIQYALTKRNTSELSIRPFLMQSQARTLAQLNKWLSDPDPHVRRLCSEGTRPRLPWAPRIPAFVENPEPLFPILEALKDDPCLYVRRSVANSLGDIAKDHPDVVFDICESWSEGANKERKWVIRHALRYPAKKGSKRAKQLRLAAG